MTPVVLASAAAAISQPLREHGCGVIVFHRRRHGIGRRAGLRARTRCSAQARDFRQMFIDSSTLVAQTKSVAAALLQLRRSVKVAGLKSAL
jgi:hypothetical protein